MRILVTGAAGFLGRHLVNALVGRGDFVCVLIRDGRDNPVLPSDSLLADGEIVTVCGSFDQVERAIAEYECDTVVHLAAQTQVSTAVADPLGTFKTNIEGTWQVLEACRRQKVDHVLIASSDKSYGDGPVPYVESQPLSPYGLYATSKACADLIADAYWQEFKLNVAITRCGNLFGPGHTNWSTLIPGTIRSILRGERPRLRSNGGPLRDWLYVEDAVDGYLRLIDQQVSGPFNFGTGVGVHVMGVVNTITKIIAPDAPESEFEPVFDNPLGLTASDAEDAGAREIRTQIVDASKAKMVLSWVPQHTLAQGLIKTVDWYRTHLEDL